MRATSPTAWPPDAAKPTSPPRSAIPTGWRANCASEARRQALHQAQRNPEAAAAAVFAVLGLGAIDILVLLPILISIVSIICAFGIVSLFGFVGGAVVLAAGPFAHAPGGPARRC